MVPHGLQRLAECIPSHVSQSLRKAWQSRGIVPWVLWPLSQVYAVLGALRRWMYRIGWLSKAHPGRPVIVVGNVVTGGGGKTPVVIAIVQHLQARGLHPGIVSRGYGRALDDCRAVRSDSSPTEAGDEPVLLARACGVPVFVAPKRIAAARALLEAHPATDIIVCDDGLQHLALARDIEVCVFNAMGLGNGFLLPAGPLREPWPRPVDAVLYAGANLQGPSAHFCVQRRLANHALRADGSRILLADLRQRPLHAVAAIAHPEDFFAMLRSQGLELVQTTALPDHYDFDSFNGMNNKRYPLICTEKDAVKLWRHDAQALAVPLQTMIDPAFFAALDHRLSALPGIPPLSLAAA